MIPPLNLAALIKGVRAVGPGVRDAVWVQGCSIGCPGCANQAYLQSEPRASMTVDRLLAHFAVRRGKIDGVTVTGGEPTEQPRAVAALLEGVQALGMSTVVFTGRTLESLRRDPGCSGILTHTDLLIDGPYLERRRDLSLTWRGSRNQRLIRLSDRFRPEDLEEDVNGEIVVSAGSIRLVGIGTRLLEGAKKRPGSAGDDPPAPPG